jgi:hypothetical protein
MASAGGGYVWPNLLFASEGDFLILAPGWLGQVELHRMAGAPAVITARCRRPQAV